MGACHEMANSTGLPAIIDQKLRLAIANRVVQGREDVVLVGDDDGGLEVAQRLDLLARGEIFDWMRSLQQEGLCRAWGASVETMEEAHTCLKQPGIASLQIIFNVFRQEAATQLLDAASEADVGVIVRVPLASGLLSGKFARETEFAETDHRHFNRDGSAFSVGETFAGIPFEAGIGLVEEMSALKPEGWSMAQFALRWILDFDAVSTVIAGASKPSQVHANIAAANLPPLSADTHEQLADFYARRVKNLVQVPV